MTYSNKSMPNCYIHKLYVLYYEILFEYYERIRIHLWIMSYSSLDQHTTS